jgi:hypothetical protein
MNGLDRFLRTDPLDAGCGETMERLDVYAELTLTDARPERRYPGVAAHLLVCGPCADDLEGLLTALRGSATPLARSGRCRSALTQPKEVPHDGQPWTAGPAGGQARQGW